MSKRSTLVQDWYRAFAGFDLSQHAEEQAPDQDLMDLEYSDAEAAMQVVLELANRPITEDAMKYLAAQHFEEICVRSGPEILENLTEREHSGARKLIPHIWVGRLNEKTRQKLLDIVSD